MTHARAALAIPLALALAFGGAAGQSGTIMYNWVAPLEIDAPGEMAAVLEVFEARRVPFALHFTPSESLMVRDSASVDGEVAPARFRPDNTNLGTFVRILEAWYAAEPFVLREAYAGQDGSRVKVFAAPGAELHRVDAGAASVEWTITEQQRQHLGYPVTVAVGEAEGERIEAWFAPHIPVSGGPALYGGLPGMILVLSLDGGLTTYAATEVSLDGVEEGTIRPPDVGEATSPEEYRAIIAGRIGEVTRLIRGMVRNYRNVECAVGLPGGAMQCNQVREGGPRARRLSNRAGPLQIGGLAPGPGAARAPHTFLLRSPS